ncbi:MAG: hypothetical protein JJE13_01495 [Thermoleophilia bacterium]|nr:hypothetical protein [Thermoleophilia bacterium]
MKYIIGSIAIAALFFGGTATAQAADDIVADAACCTFIDGPFTQVAGEIPKFVNPQGADAPHNVTSTVNGPDGNVLFGSATVPAGQSSPVEGAQYLSDGTYPFFCTIHGLSMSGDLVVAGGTPLERPKPEIRLSFPAQKLKSVRNSSKVKIKIKGVTDSSGIKLTVSKGKKKLGSASGISVSAGKTRTVAVKLTNKGQKTVKIGKKILFLVKGTVAGGKSATARRTLR